MSPEKRRRAGGEGGGQDRAPHAAVGEELPIPVIERAMNPIGLGEIPDPDGYGFVQADCGDTMEICLRVRENRIQEARFTTTGCGPTLACGSVAAELAQGRKVIEALRIGPRQISEALGGLPAARLHCAEFAHQALKKALDDYLTRARDPWKKYYPRS
ncbi:MAG: iron-sulfur cluster assembly scaffold protein [bacterium]